MHILYNKPAWLRRNIDGKINEYGQKDPIEKY
jgi:hypothetical protein